MPDDGYYILDVLVSAYNLLVWWGPERSHYTDLDSAEVFTREHIERNWDSFYNSYGIRAIPVALARKLSLQSAGVAVVLSEHRNELLNGALKQRRKGKKVPHA